MNYLGRYLKKRLKELKMSEREVAAKCGISHSYLNQLIKGLNPSTKKTISPTLSTLEKLSTGFGVSAEYLQQVTYGKVTNSIKSAKKNPIETNLCQIDYSPNLLKQIAEFQDFMVEVGAHKHNKSEAEWAEFITEIRNYIKIRNELIS